MEKTKRRHSGIERMKFRDKVALETLLELEENLEYNMNTVEAYDEYYEGMLKGYEEVMNLINVMKERYTNE